MKKILLAILMLGLIAAGVGYYMYNKPTESLVDAKPALSISADSLFKAYEADEAAANKMYVDKIIEVNGKLQSVNSDTSGLSLSLQTSSGMFGVICKLEDKEATESQFQVGQDLKLKGICTGYLMDVVLIRCVPVE